MAKARSNDFEKAFTKLETIVRKLEQEELSLDESLKLFEEGVTLSRLCHGKLEEIEKKIETILADAKGDPIVKDFDKEDDADAEGDEDEEEESEEGLPF